MIRKDYVFHWQNWQRTLKKLDAKPRKKDLYRASMAVLRTHESKDFLGGIIAQPVYSMGFQQGRRGSGRLSL